MPSLLDLRRTTAALIAVAMSAALIAFALITSDTFRTRLLAGARASVGDADIVVTDHRGQDTTQGPLDDDLVACLSALDGVAAVRGTHWDVIQLDLPNQLAHSVGTSVAAQDVPALSQYTILTSGRLPTGTGEVAVSTEIAKQQEIGVGDTIRLTDHDHTVRSSPTVVGIISPGADAGLEGLPGVYATADQLAAMGAETSYRNLYVTSRPGAGTGALSEKVAMTVRAAQPSAVVQDADEAVAQRAASSTAGGTMITTLLNLLAPVCAIVAGIVIATTFTTLVARQTRIIGLMRCVGASRAQVMLAVLRTAALTGLLGSIIGAAAGTGAAALLIRSGTIEGLRGAHPTVSSISLVATVAIGTLVTLAAVLRPARRATRVSPLVALTGQTASPARAGRARRWAAVIGLLVTVAGAALTVLSAIGRNPYGAAGGGVIVVLGMLAALPLLVTAVIGLIGRLGAEGRFPLLHLAARNLARNPGRSTATAATLLVCVMVGSVLFVGLFSFRSSFQAIVAQSSPVDIRVFGVTPDTDTAALTSTIEGIDGVESTALVPTLSLTHTVAGQTGQTGQAEETEKTDVIVVDAEATAPVVRSDKGLEDLSDDALIVGGIYDIPDGATVTLTGPAGSVDLTARVREGWGAAITPATAARLNGGAPTDAQVWVRARGEGSSEPVEEAVRRAVRGQDLMSVGSAAGRTMFEDTLNRTVLTICLVMSSALVIALSGLANTTDVSVLERTREIGVLRATGTSRSEIRRLIITETALLAGVGGLLGVVAGTGLGAAGTIATMGDGGVSVFIPYLPLTGVLAVTLAVGVLASLRPAGRAAAVAPVTALAQE